MLVPHMSVNSTGEKYSMMHKDLKDLDRSERSETKIAALGRDDKRLYFAAKGLNLAFHIHRNEHWLLLVSEMSQTVRYKINESLNKKRELRY